MPRYTFHFWICRCSTRNGPGEKRCSNCGALRVERCAAVHSSERAVVYVHPLTGERRTPARADQPMPEVYANQGFERVEIESMVKFERETGLIHEPTNFNAGNEAVPVEPPHKSAPRKLIDSLARDISDAAASGPWTYNENGPNSFAA